jgi:hypothetical protein
MKRRKEQASKFVGVIVETPKATPKLVRIVTEETSKPTPKIVRVAVEETPKST